MATHEERTEWAEDLEDAASYFNDELGETWDAMAKFAQFVSYMSEELQEAFDKELESEHKRFKRDFVLREEEVTRTSTAYSLEYEPQEEE